MPLYSEHVSCYCFLFQVFSTRLQSLRGRHPRPTSSQDDSGIRLLQRDADTRSLRSAKLVETLRRKRSGSVHKISVHTAHNTRVLSNRNDDIAVVAGGNSGADAAGLVHENGNLPIMDVEDGTRVHGHRIISPSFLPLAGNCAVCGRASILRCARCNNNGNVPIRFFCSRKCQKADWSVHKRTCQFTIFAPLFGSSNSLSSLNAANTRQNNNISGNNSSNSLSRSSILNTRDSSTSTSDSPGTSVPAGAGRVVQEYCKPVIDNVGWKVNGGLLEQPRSMVATRSQAQQQNSQSGGGVTSPTSPPTNAASVSTGTDTDDYQNAMGTMKDRLDGLPPKKHYPALPSSYTTPPRQSSGGINPSTLQRQGIVGEFPLFNNDRPMRAPTKEEDDEVTRLSADRCLPCNSGAVSGILNGGSSSSGVINNGSQYAALNTINEEESKQDDDNSSVVAQSGEEFEIKVANLRDNLGLDESEIRAALSAFDGDADQAAEWIFSNPGVRPPHSDVRTNRGRTRRAYDDSSVPDLIPLDPIAQRLNRAAMAADSGRVLPSGTFASVKNDQKRRHEEYIANGGRHSPSGDPADDTVSRCQVAYLFC
jgi:predicted RNA-binding Zn-ribbon protein involved in translation (DUF1610 family)